MTARARFAMTGLESLTQDIQINVSTVTVWILTVFFVYCTSSLTGGACPVQEITILQPQDGGKRYSKLKSSFKYKVIEMIGQLGLVLQLL
jgi:hypothetical protein